MTAGAAVMVTTKLTVADDDGGRLRKQKGEGSWADMAAFNITNERASTNMLRESI